MLKDQKDLASFCRLCLSKAGKKVPIFGKEEDNILNLLLLIDLDLVPESESDAVVCLDCIVTLEGFLQFKEQCHENNQYLKTLPPKDSAKVSGDSEDEYEAADSDYLEDDPLGNVGGPARNYDSEEEGLVEDYEPQEPISPPKMLPPKRKVQTQTPYAKKGKLNKPAKKTPKKKTVASPVQSAVSPYIPEGVIIKPVVVKRYDTPAELDLAEVERECQELNIRRCRRGPAFENMLVLQDSYPDYFFFEKGPRSLYFTLVYYGERFHSANHSERYTYWKCIHRRKQKCKAIVCAWNDYQKFERRFEHTHGKLPEKEGLVQFTPLQALPEIFRITRHMVEQKKARYRKAKVDRVKEQLALKDIEKVKLEQDANKPDVLTKVLHKSGVLDSDTEGEDE